mmetsp:Transcript_27747/g.70030  ORF Transcript_27747/g.70030 Transcript_27747/m.70030 type:complete len:363 (+) Transcript_27747:1222-2310(+)
MAFAVSPKTLLRRRRVRGASMMIQVVARVHVQVGGGIVPHVSTGREVGQGAHTGVGSRVVEDQRAARGGTGSADHRLLVVEVVLPARHVVHRLHRRQFQLHGNGTLGRSFIRTSNRLCRVRCMGGNMKICRGGGSAAIRGGACSGVRGARVGSGRVLQNVFNRGSSGRRIVGRIRIRAGTRVVRRVGRGSCGGQSTGWCPSSCGTCSRGGRGQKTRACAGCRPDRGRGHPQSEQPSRGGSVACGSDSARGQRATDRGSKDGRCGRSSCGTSARGGPLKRHAHSTRPVHSNSSSRDSCRGESCQTVHRGEGLVYASRDHWLHAQARRNGRKLVLRGNANWAASGGGVDSAGEIRMVKTVSAGP